MKEKKISRRKIIGAGAALIAGRALAQNVPGAPPGGPPGGPPGATRMPPMRPPLEGPQVAPPAEPLFPPFPAVGSVEQFDPALADLIDVSTPVEKILDGFVWV